MRTRRWIGLMLFALAFSALCVRLGFWQWHRMEHKKHAASILARHMKSAPTPLESALELGHEMTDDQEWTKVRATGHFDSRHQVTVKFTTREGSPGADVVTPLLLDGRAILVDRGWMPTTNDAERPRNVPSPPSGLVTIVGWLRPDNRAEINAVTPVEGQVRAIASRGMRDFVGMPLLHGYINQQSPRPERLSPEPRPHIGHALNFFYAWQWWFFAGLALIGPFWFARDEAVRQGR